MRLAPLADQTIVITGASSGLGLATARLAVDRGARVVVASRNADALDKLAADLQSRGGAVLAVPCDVRKLADVERLASLAIERFGGFDSWINNAGVSIYGPMEQIALDDLRAVMETNFWGVVHGSIVAARHLRGKGGALVNIGSALSDRAIPLQGMYSASKHAVQGFTDALRMELEHDGAPVSVTLVKPSSLDTPYRRHAKNYLDTEPNNPPPVYAPEVAAKAVLYCCEHPRRSVVVGGGGKAAAVLGKFAPRLSDRLMEATLFRLQRTGRPPRARDDNALKRPGDARLHVRGGTERHVARTSAFTAASLHPWLAVAGVVGLVGMLALARR